MPWPSVGENMIVSLIRQGRLAYSRMGDSEVRALVQKMAAVKPKDRPTIDDILKDSFVAETGTRCSEFPTKPGRKVGSLPVMI
jgi:hypothetical protein